MASDFYKFIGIEKPCIEHHLLNHVYGCCIFRLGDLNRLCACVTFLVQFRIRSRKRRFAELRAQHGPARLSEISQKAAWMEEIQSIESKRHHSAVKNILI
jgi:hypothetical protein